MKSQPEGKQCGGVNKGEIRLGKKKNKRIQLKLGGAFKSE